MSEWLIVWRFEQKLLETAFLTENKSNAAITPWRDGCFFLI